MISWIDLFASLNYDPVTGVWTRLIPASSRGKRGSRADRPSVKGALVVSIQGKAHYSHRLAWKYMTGSWPKEDVDHKNTNNKNNIWTNLRLATDSQNLANRPKQKNNTSGYKGVTWQADKKKWKAQIGYQCKNLWLGYADTPEGAYKLYVEANERLFGEFARA